MEKLKKKNLFFCQLLLLIILSFSLIIPNSIVCVKAETIDEQTTISVQEIIENTTFVTFRKGDETSQYGRNMFACFYVPNSVYESSYTYGLVLFPKDYGEKLGITSDYLKKAEEQNIYIANIPAPASLAAENGRLFKFGIINILEQNIERTFSFIFYVQDVEGNIAYAKPQFAAWSTLNAEEYTDAQVIAMIEGRVTMETSFGTIVEKISELVNSFWVYIVLAMGATVVVWGTYLGIRVAVAKRKEEQINARGMIKNLVVGIIVMFTIAMAVPLLINGLSWWVTW